MPEILLFLHTACPPGSRLLNSQVRYLIRFLRPSSPLLENLSREWGCPCLVTHKWGGLVCPGHMDAAGHLQFWQGGRAESWDLLSKNPSRRLHAVEPVCALATSPAHLDCSCTVVTSLSYPETLDKRWSYFSVQVPFPDGSRQHSWHKITVSWAQGTGTGQRA